MHEGMIDLIQMTLHIEKEYHDQLVWLCDQINEKQPSLVAEAILQAGIEHTVSTPEALQEWIDAFTEG